MNTHPTICAVTRLHLSAFRNYASLSLQADAQPIILTGPNGAGKTNILEAVSFLAPGRGLRGARLFEIDRLNGESPWAVAAEVSGPQGNASIGTGRDPEAAMDKRIIRIEGKAVRGQGELSRYLSMLWVTPSMDQLFLEGHGARRRFLDRLVYSFDPEHASRVAAYEHCVRERNRLLAEPRFGADPAWLDPVEQKIAARAVEITLARLSCTEHLNNAVAMSQGSFPKARLALHGQAEKFLSEGATALEAETRLAGLLAAARAPDSRTGRTSVGAHASEVQVEHLGKRTEAALCSTGEQKALLLSIILAQARAASVWHGTVPILLLDEVIAHLDAVRRDELRREILALSAQAWMTGTDAADFSGWEGNAQYFRVEDGRVKKEREETA